MPPQDRGGSDDQPHRSQPAGWQRPGDQDQPRPLRPRQPRMSTRPLAQGDSKLMTQHQDLGVLHHASLPGQAQHRHGGTGDNEDDQLQAHKPAIIARPPRREPATSRRARALTLRPPRRIRPRWHAFSAPTARQQPAPDVDRLEQTPPAAAGRSRVDLADAEDQAEAEVEQNALLAEDDRPARRLPAEGHIVRLGADQHSAVVVGVAGIEQPHHLLVVLLALLCSSSTTNLSWLTRSAVGSPIRSWLGPPSRAVLLRPGPSWRRPTDRARRGAHQAICQDRSARIGSLCPFVLRRHAG